MDARTEKRLKGFKDLNTAERRLVRETAKGRVTVLKANETLRAEVVRALACQESFEGCPIWPITSDGVRIAGREIDGKFVGGKIEGRLVFANRTIAAPLSLCDIDVKEGIDLSDARTRFLSFDRSRIGGIVANAAQIQGHFSVKDATITGVCDINGATIEGQFHATGTTFNNADGNAIFAQLCHIKGGLFLDRATVRGSCDISAATIEAVFTARGATFTKADDFAILAQMATINNWIMRPVELENGELRSTSVAGGIDVVATQIKIDFDLRGIRLSAAHQVALSARGLNVEGSTYMWSDARIDGAVLLSGATIKGSLSIQDVYIASAAKARMRAQSPLAPLPAKKPEQDDSQWAHHALDLSETEIGWLVMAETAGTQPLGILDLSRAKVGTFTDFADAWPPPVDPHSRACTGRQCDEQGNDADHLVLDGFEYEHLDQPDGRRSNDSRDNRDVAAARLAWLRAQSRADLFKQFRPQPWRQLAKVLDAQGYEEDARRIAIERRVALRFADGAPRFQNLISRTLQLFAEYGFNPWRTVAWSVATVLFFASIYFVAAHSFCTSREPLCADQTAFVRVLAADFVPAVPNEAEANKTLALFYPAFDPLLYSLDAFLPLFNLGTEPYWRPNEHLWVVWPSIGNVPVGHILQYLYVLEQIFGAILVSLAITGFTGLLTRDER